ncbi:hypothetical protein BDV39DRAFT_174692, partial [Aspergillus sergii]
MHRKTQESLLWKWKHAYLTCRFVSPKIPGYNLLRSRSTPQDRYIPYNHMIPT